MHKSTIAENISPDEGWEVRKARVCAVDNGTVDVIPVGGNAVVFSVQVTGGAMPEVGDDVLLFTRGNDRIVKLVEGEQQSGERNVFIENVFVTNAYGGSGMTVHDLDGQWHSGTLPWAKVDKLGSSLAHLSIRNYSDLQNRGHALDGADHTGTLSWAKVNKTGSSLADLATRNYSDLQNRAHSLDGSDHTGTLSWARVDKAGSSLADLAIRNYVDLQNRTHDINGADHTGTLSWAKVNKTGASLADLQIRNYSDLQNRVHNIVSEHAGTGAQLDLIGFVSTDTLGVITPSSNPGQSRAIMATNSTGGFTFSGNVFVGDIALATDGTLSSSSHLSLYGQSVRPTSDAAIDLGLSSHRWKELNVLSIRASQLVQHASISTIGGRFLVGLSAKLVSPVSSSDTEIVIDSDGFADQDVILFQKGTTTEYMRVTSAPVASGSGWKYDVLRDLTDTNSPDPSWDVGDVCFNTGQDGTGWLDLFSSAWSDGPAINVNVRTGSSATSIATRVKIGKLDGINDPDFGALSGYGLLAENANIKGSLFATGRIRAGSGNSTVIIDPNDPDYRLWSGNQNPVNAPFKIEADGSVIARDGEIGGWLIDQYSISSAKTNARIVLDNRQYGGLISYADGDTFDPSTGNGTYQVMIDKATGNLLAGGGDIRINSSGVLIRLQPSHTSSKPIRWVNHASDTLGEIAFRNPFFPFDNISGFVVRSYTDVLWLVGEDGVDVKIPDNLLMPYSWSGLSIRPAYSAIPPKVYFVGAQAHFQPVSGSPPIYSESTLLCPNLNADMLDGQHASEFAPASHTHVVSNYSSAPNIHGSTAFLEMTTSWQFIPGLDTGNITPSSNETWIVLATFRVVNNPPSGAIGLGDDIRFAFDVNGTNTRGDSAFNMNASSTSGSSHVSFFEIVNVNASVTTRLRVKAMNNTAARGRIGSSYMMVWRLRR